MKDKIIDGICGLIERIKNPVNYVNTPDWKKTPLRRFEDEMNPLKLRGHLIKLGLDKDYALCLSGDYAMKIYNPVIAEHLRINDSNSHDYRIG